MPTDAELKEQYDREMYEQEMYSQEMTASAPKEEPKDVTIPGTNMSPEEGMDAAAAALQHGTQGMAFGFGDELSGLSEAAGQMLGLQGVGGPITDIGISDSGPTLDMKKLMMAYDRGKEAQVKQLEDTQEKSPKTAFTSDLVGGTLAGFALPVEKLIAPMAGAASPIINSAKALLKGKSAAALPEIASSAVPALSSGMKALPGAQAAAQIGGQVGGQAANAASQAARSVRDVTKIEKLLNPAAEGALLGGIEGLGRSDDGRELSGTLIGAALGGTAGKLMSKIGSSFTSKNLEAGAKSLKKGADMDALATIGGTKKDFAKEFGVGNSNRPDLDHMKGIGRELIKSKIVSVKGSMEDVINKVDDVISSNIDWMSRSIDSINSKWKVPDIIPDNVMSSFKKNFDNFVDTVSVHDNREALMVKAEESAKTVASELQYAIDSKDFGQLLKLKNKVGQYLSDKDWITRSDGMKPIKALYRDMYHTIKNYTEDIAKSHSPLMGKTFSETNKTLSNLYDARSIAMNQFLKEAPKFGTKYGDYLAVGLGSALTGGFGGGAAALAGKKGIEHALGKDSADILRALSGSAKESFGNAASSLANSPKTLKAIQKTTEQVRPAIAAGAAKYGNESSESVVRDFNSKMNERLKNASPESLNEVAGLMETNYGEAGQLFSNDLKRTAKEDSMSRTQTVHKLMQSPRFREMLRELKMKQ